MTINTKLFLYTMWASIAILSSCVASSDDDDDNSHAPIEITSSEFVAEPGLHTAELILKPESITIPTAGEDKMWMFPNVEATGDYYATYREALDGNPGFDVTYYSISQLGVLDAAPLCAEYYNKTSTELSISVVDIAEASVTLSDETSTLYIPYQRTYYSPVNVKESFPIKFGNQGAQTTELSVEGSISVPTESIYEESFIQTETLSNDSEIIGWGRLAFGGDTTEVLLKRTYHTDLYHYTIGGVNASSSLISKLGYYQDGYYAWYTYEFYAEGMAAPFYFIAATDEDEVLYASISVNYTEDAKKNFEKKTKLLARPNYLKSLKPIAK